MPKNGTFYVRLVIEFETGAGSPAVIRWQDFTLAPICGPAEAPHRLQKWEMVLGGRADRRDLPARTGGVRDLVLPPRS